MSGRTSSLQSRRQRSAGVARRSRVSEPEDFALRWTAAFTSLVDDLRLGDGRAPSLGSTAAILARHGARLIPGTQCVISVVPHERPGSFTALAGAGDWASALVGGEWPLAGTLDGRAMLGGAPVETTKAQRESATPEVLAPGGIDTGRVIPLGLGGPVPDGRVAMGAIGFWRPGHQPFIDLERSLMDTFGRLATVLLHRAELLGAATRTAQRLECAVDVAVATAASLVPTSVMRRLLERSLDAIAADRASLCRIQDATMTVVDVVDRDQAATDGAGVSFGRPWHPAVDRAVVERRPVAVGPVPDSELHPAWRSGFQAVERTLFAPLLAEGEVIALLTLMRRHDRPFTDADLNTVQLIGNIAALSLRNAERYAESERAHQRSLRALREIAGHLDDAYALNAFFGRLTESIARLVHARGAAFLSLCPDGSLELVQRAHNIVAPRPGRTAPLAAGSLPWRVVHGDDVVRVADSDTAAQWLPGLRAQSMMAVSWRAGDRVLGSLIAVDALGPQGFTADDMWVLRMAALAAGLLLQHKEVSARELELAREARERGHEINVVQAAAQALSSALDIGDVYRQVVQSAAHVVTRPASAARRATLLRIDGERATIIAEFDESGQRTDVGVYDLQEHPAMRRVVDEGTVVVVDLTGGDVAPPTARQMRSMGVVSSAMAPVRVDDRVVAILRVSARDESAFEPAHLERLRAIANVAALAIGNAERYDLAHQEALRQAELEKIKSEFLRLASHELRGPIGLLRGYLGMFEDGTVPLVTGRARETLPILRAKLSQMSRMVDDMLETARLEEGQLHLRREEADLRSLVEVAVDAVRPLASPQHELKVMLPRSPVRIIADKASIETIVTNLLDNAIKYSPAGGAVECTLTEASGSASVAVRDRGLGIAPDDLPRLFTKFGRILTPQNSHIGGTGLGLHLAQQLAQLHGGGIRVSSRPERGSVFTLSLPVTRSHDSAPDSIR